MARAIIVFADGSKQMSHNLDDSRFRWHERKLVTYDDISNAYGDGITIRDTSHPSHLSEAQEWRTELIKQQIALQSQLIILSEGKLDHSNFSKDAMLLDVAARLVVSQITLLNASIKVKKAERQNLIEGKAQERRDKVKIQQERILTLQKENNRLRQRIAELEAKNGTVVKDYKVIASDELQPQTT